MPDDKKSDSFKAPQPSIPGVPADAAKSKAKEPPAATSYTVAPEGDKPPQHLTWVIAAVVAVCSVGGALLIWHNMSPSHAGGPAASESATAELAFAAEPVRPTRDLPVGPGPIATANELAKPWASKRFSFPDSVTAEPLTAMVVHLPDGGYWAFSLKEPFGNCALDYVTDLEKLRDDYNFSATHPMVVNTCNRTVYDLLRYGGPSDNSLVRGDVVQGPGLRPPMAIEVRVEGTRIVAVQME
jgi:hypothetical protein